MKRDKHRLNRAEHSIKSKNRYVNIGIILFLFTGLCMISFSQEQEKEHTPIKHEVSVTRMLIPVFALDSKGNPVYDLQKDDLVLYLNGKKVKIDSFNAIEFAYDQETLKKIKKEKEAVPETVIQERIVFLVIDTMYNSFYGLKNAKKIAGEFVDSDSLEELFVVMQNSLFGGLKLMGGPEKDKKKVKKYIKKISGLPDKNPTVDSTDITVRSIQNPAQDFDLMAKRQERMHAKENIKFFVDFLARLKYSLQAIDKPKIIILISEGLPEILFFESNPYLTHNVNYDPEPLLNIKRLVKEINEAGSVIYAVYPGRDKLYKEKFNFAELGKGFIDFLDYEDTVDSIDIPIARQSGIESLKTISVGSGGRVFEGHAEEVVKEIRKTTSAYYEVAFSPGAELGDDIRIKIKCKRKGVKISSPVLTARSKSYIDMDAMQKKVFALNLVMGQSWASMMAKMEKSPFQWQDSEKKAIAVKMPEMMQGRAADIFLIRFEKDFKNLDIWTVNKKVSDTEIIEIKEKKAGQSLYFLIIEPESVVCLFNMIN